MTRDPQGPVRLLRAERDSLLPILRRTPGEAFGRPPAALVAGHAALIKIFAGRPADPAGYELTGAGPGELVVF